PDQPVEPAARQLLDLLLLALVARHGHAVELVTTEADDPHALVVRHEAVGPVELGPADHGICRTARADPVDRVGAARLEPFLAPFEPAVRDVDRPIGGGCDAVEEGRADRADLSEGLARLAIEHA